jgi:hypothetical protein
MSESEAEANIKNALERERLLREQFAKGEDGEEQSAEEVIRRALEKEKQMKEQFEQDAGKSEAENILTRALEKERQMRENFEKNAVEGEESKLPTLQEVMDALEKDDMVNTIKEKGLLSEEALDAFLEKTDGLTAAEALANIKKMDLGVPEDVLDALGEGIVSFSGILEDTWSDLSKDFLSDTDADAALEAGAKVFTSQGSGTIVSFDMESKTYEIKLEEEHGGEQVKLSKGLVFAKPPIELTDEMSALIPPELQAKLEEMLTDEVRADMDDRMSKGRMMWATLYSKKPELFDQVSGVLGSAGVAGQVKGVQETLSKLLENNKDLLNEGKAKLTEITQKVEASGLGNALSEASDRMEKAVEGNTKIAETKAKVKELSKSRRATAIMDKLQDLASKVGKTDAAQKLLTDVASEGKQYVSERTDGLVQYVRDEGGVALMKDPQLQQTLLKEHLAKMKETIEEAQKEGEQGAAQLQKNLDEFSLEEQLKMAEDELKKFEQQANVQEVLEKGRLLYKELALAKGLGVSEDATPEELLEKATSYVPLMADKAVALMQEYSDQIEPADLDGMMDKVCTIHCTMHYILIHCTMHYILIHCTMHYILIHCTMHYTP